MSVVVDVENEIVKVLAVYSSYRRAVVGEFARFLMTPEALTPSSKPVLRKALELIALPAIENVLAKSAQLAEFIGTLLIETAIRPEDRQVVTSADFDLLDGFMEAALGRMEQAIVEQIRADVLQVAETHQRFLIRVHLAAATSNMESAVFAERSRAMQNVELYHRDSLGRRRDSEQFVFTELRYAIYRWFNISMVYLLSKLGYERARIYRPLSNLHNVVIDLDTFDELEATVFHPNAKALILP